MNSRLILRTVLVLIGAVALLSGQDLKQATTPPAAESPVAPQPKIKSKKELEAIQAIMNAPDPASRIKAADDLILKFKDTEFKAFALQMATVSAQQLNDYEKIMLYGERTLEADPNNYVAMLAMAGALAQKTRQFDLDKEEKLGRATKLTEKALKILETAPRPNPGVSDAQWAAAKADYQAQAYVVDGMIALVRKDNNKAVEAFKKAIDTEKTPNPATKLRLAAAYNRQGNHGEAIATLDGLLADPNLHPQIRQFAEREKARAVQAKNAQNKK